MSLKELYTDGEPEQAAVIPYRIRDGRIEVLLITTRGKGKWIVPKGWIEKGLSPHASAEKEAMEEAGVEGSVRAGAIGRYRHGSGDQGPIVEVYLMRVDRELPSWPEQAERIRQWVSLETACGQVEKEGLKSMLDEVSTTINPAGDLAAGVFLLPKEPERPSTS